MRIKAWKLFFLVLLTSVALIYYVSQTQSSSVRVLFKASCDIDCVHHLLNSTKKPLYQVYTPSCIIPNIDVYHPSVVGWKFKEPVKVVCSSKQPLTESSGLQLYLRKERYWQYGLQSPDFLNCSYQGIVRVQQDPNHYNGGCDSGVKYKEEVPLLKDVTPIDEDGIYVFCKTTNNETEKPLYKNIHYFIQPRRVKEKREMQKMIGVRGSKPDQLSILIMGIDSLSRSNFVRNMPRSFHYITHELNAIDMKGFVRIGGNTFPNIVALLTGMKDVDIKKHPCLPRHNAKFDDCPFIWKNLSSNGYATAFIEDAPWMGSFRYTRSGFVLEPTDYYATPYFLVSESKIAHSAGFRGQNGQICQGGKLSSSVIYDYSLEVADALRDIPYFSYYWAAAMTHDKFGLPTALDQPTLEYLQKLSDGGYLEHTILFLMSDHGLRYAGIKQTYAGQIEENMPLLMIVMPQWFKDKYPDVAKNLEINTGRITTALDIYGTFQDINNRAYTDLTKSYVGEKYGQSLFREIPLLRTCNATGILHYLCPCQNTTAIIDLEDPLLLGSVNHTLNVLNEGLRNFPGCAQLNLGKVLRGQLNSPGRNTLPGKMNTLFNTYKFKFTVQPGGAEVESAVLYDVFTQTYKLATELSQITVDSDRERQCINDETYKKFCYCKS